MHPRADGRKTDTLRHPLQPPCPSSCRPTQPLPRVSSTYKRVDAGRESMTVDDFTYTSPPVSSALFSVDSVASRFAAYRILTPTPPTPSSRAPLLTCFSREKRPFEVPSLLPNHESILVEKDRVYRRGEENEETNFSTNFFSSSSSLLRAILPLSRKFSNFDRTIIDLYYTRFLIPKIHPVVKRCPLSRHLFVFSIKYNLSQCNEPEKKKRKRGREKKKKKLSNDQSRFPFECSPWKFRSPTDALQNRPSKVDRWANAPPRSPKLFPRANWRSSTPMTRRRGPR